ncbi:MAG TPA: aminodeoxychorismate/anthranilate synthase component II, partial [Bacteroidales bacterium]|nr:aminodeoxychorismate/anthranilate synthase component II [Bacteroidales bacterium]
QAINEYFGGSIRKLSFPKHGHHLILKNINNRDILFKDIDKEIEVARYHSWTIDALGKDLEISSLDEDNNIMSVFHRKYKINGVQFHPESIITNCGKEIISNWLFNN